MRSVQRAGGGSRARGVSRGGQVLVVLGSEEHRHQVRLVLERDGSAVEATGDPGEAVIRASQARPDLAVVGLGLEDLGGLTLLAYLRLKWSVPVIVVADGGDEARRTLAWQLGAKDCLDEDSLAEELAPRALAVLRWASLPP